MAFSPSSFGRVLRIATRTFSGSSVAWAKARTFMYPKGVLEGKGHRFLVRAILAFRFFLGLRLRFRLRLGFGFFLFRVGFYDFDVLVVGGFSSPING